MMQILESGRAPEGFVELRPCRQKQVKAEGSFAEDEHLILRVRSRDCRSSAVTPAKYYRLRTNATLAIAVWHVSDVRDVLSTGGHRLDHG